MKHEEPVLFCGEKYIQNEYLVDFQLRANREKNNALFLNEEGREPRVNMHMREKRERMKQNEERKRKKHDDGGYKYDMMC